MDCAWKLLDQQVMAGSVRRPDVCVCVCRVDCVGILKLRNADVEARIGVAGSKKKSTRARLVFRVNIPRPDGTMITLQTPSSPILCSESLIRHQLPWAQL